MIIVIYISELRPDLLDDVVTKYYLMITKVQNNEFKKLMVGSGANFDTASHFVVDLSSINDDQSEILEAVNAIKSMYKNKRIVFIADKEPENSVLLNKLFEKGVYDIVTDLTSSELEKCMITGKTKEEASIFSLNNKLTPVKKEEINVDLKHQQSSELSTTTPQPKPIEIAKEKITANRSFRKVKPFATVAICSTEPHMGATHQALLIAKFLNSIGFKACYLEANPTQKIFYVAQAYSVNANEKKRLLQFEGVDMYFDFKLPDVISAGYDFFVFDFGVFSGVESTTFLTKDIKIVVGGSKAWEIPAYRTVFDSVGNSLSGKMDIHFILNFAPKRENADIKELMGEYKGTTHFSDYAPYPFELAVNRHIYKRIFEDYVYVEKLGQTGTATSKKSWLPFNKK